MWLSDIAYQPPAGPTGQGTLRYKVTSVLSDDGNPGYEVRHNVHILGSTAAW